MGSSGQQFPGQYAIIIINTKEKKKRKEIQTSFPRLWRETVAYIWSQRSSCTQFTNHHVHGQKTEASRENNYWHLLDLKDVAASSRHHQTRRTRFQLFCFVSRTLFECGEVCQLDNLLVRLGQTTRHICVPLNWCNSSDVLLLGVNFVVCSDSWSREILFLIFPLKL